METALTHPLHKKGDKQDARSVSLLQVTNRILSKMFIDLWIEDYVVKARRTIGLTPVEPEQASSLILEEGKRRRYPLICTRARTSYKLYTFKTNYITFIKI